MWEDFRNLKQESTRGLGAFEDLDMFNHQVFKDLIPVLEVGEAREDDNRHPCPLYEHDTNAAK